MTRLVKHHPALFSFALVLLAIPFLVRAATVAAAPPAAVSSGDLATTLIRAGLDAEALAASGVNSGQATGVVDDFEAAMALEPGRLSTADAKYSTAKSTSDSLRRLIQSGRGNQTDVANYQQAMSDLDAAELERESALDEWFDAGTAGLSANSAATLRTIRGNRDWGLDLEMLAVDRTEAEWVKLRDSLTHERVAQKYAEPVDAGIASYLASCRSVPAVASAKSSSAANLAKVKSSWKAAVQ